MTILLPELHSNFSLLKSCYTCFSHSHSEVKPWKVAHTSSCSEVCFTFLEACSTKKLSNNLQGLQGTCLVLFLHVFSSEWFPFEFSHKYLFTHSWWISVIGRIGACGGKLLALVNSALSPSKLPTDGRTLGSGPPIQLYYNHMYMIQVGERTVCLKKKIETYSRPCPPDFLCSLTKHFLSSYLATVSEVILCTSDLHTVSYYYTCVLQCGIMKIYMNLSLGHSKMPEKLGPGGGLAERGALFFECVELQETGQSNKTPAYHARSHIQSLAFPDRARKDARHCSQY
ncbi:hypothetical protein EYD10_04659 [Varanus komodoensis]|nr:hypothetical protein EYD10_04659 [Varanus komodoensis]